MAELYSDVEFRAHASGMPWGACVMVATIDGKSVSGNRNESVMDLGSKIDHGALRMLESKADAVLIGAQTLRATKGIHYDNRLYKIVVTKSGKLDWNSRFFSDCPARAIVAATPQAEFQLPSGCLRVDLDGIEWGIGLFRYLSERLGVRSVLIEGGSELNAEMMRFGLVDELFLTIAPKVKLGRETATIAGGAPLNRDEMLAFRLENCKVIGDEVFLRYRRSVP